MNDSVVSLDDDDSYIHHGPMKDLALRMSEIDKQLDEITSSDPSKNGNKNKSNNESEQNRDSTSSTRTETAGNSKGRKNVGVEFTPESLAAGGGSTEKYTYGKESNGGVMISTFDDSRFSVFSDFELDGDDLVSLQGELAALETLDENVKTATATGISDKNGKARVVEATVSETITKPTPESPIGISMKTVKRITRIVAIAEDGLLADTNLRPGLELVSINGITIRNAKHARYLIQNSKKELTLIAQKIIQD